MSDYSNINNYILKDDIGEGNFGKVKLGVFKNTGEEFAIKILNKKKIKIKMKNTVFKENDIIKRFNHVNVIFVLDIIEDPENYYIVMEYCKKGELFDYIVDQQRLEEDEAAYFFYQLINGVEYIHSLDVAHRDLKPENLLLNENKILKIIDFGLSHEFNGEELLKTKCGSPSYAAPEIIKGLKYDGFKTDVWCCGIILYAMVCGYLPFEGDTNKILFKNIVECKPDIPEYLSEDTQDLISSILKPEPNDRLTIEQIKEHDFYLRGKSLCDIDYPKMQRLLNQKRYNMNNSYNDNSLKNEIDAGMDDVEFINQKINITIDNDSDNEEKVNDNDSDMLIIDKKDGDNSKNKDNNKNKKSKDNVDTSNKNNEDNDILIRSFHDISTSKINNNSRHDNKIEINIRKLSEKKKKSMPKLNNRKSSNGLRDIISAWKKIDINKKLENFNNNMVLILNTDINAIVNNKLNQNPMFNNNQNIDPNANLNSNDLETNNTNNINTVSTTINEKKIYANNIMNKKKSNNNINNEKKQIIQDKISSKDKNEKSERSKILEKRIKENNFDNFKNKQNNINYKNNKINDKYIINFNCFNRRVKKNNITKNNTINLNNNYLNNNSNNVLNSNKNSINIINNINNTINNYGILNVSSTINNANPNNNLITNNKQSKRSKFLSERNEKVKTDNNMFNAIKDLINAKQKKKDNSNKIPKISPGERKNYLKNIKKDIHSTKSSNSGSTRNNRSNNQSNSKIIKNKNKNVLYPNNVYGMINKKGFKIKQNKNSNNNSNNNIIASIDSNKNKNNQYPSLNIGNQLFLENKINNNNINNNYNKKSISISGGKNLNKNVGFYNRNLNINRSGNKIANKKNAYGIKNNSNSNEKIKQDCINYFNSLSTMFMKTDNNARKNKFINSNTASVNSRSKNSKNSKNTTTSKNSKSSNSKSSKKKYNLIRQAIKHKMGNFIFNKKGGSEGKTNRFIQHSKLFNVNTSRNKNVINVPNINNNNNINANYMGMNDHLKYISNNKYNDISNNKGIINNENNIKIIRPKGNKSRKKIYYQINFENFRNNLNTKNKKKLPYLANKK